MELPAVMPISLRKTFIADAVTVDGAEYSSVRGSILRRLAVDPAVIVPIVGMTVLSTDAALAEDAMRSFRITLVAFNVAADGPDTVRIRGKFRTNLAAEPVEYDRTGLIERTSVAADPSLVVKIFGSCFAIDAAELTVLTSALGIAFTIEATEAAVEDRVGAICLTTPAELPSELGLITPTSRTIITPELAVYVSVSGFVVPPPPEEVASNTAIAPT